MNHSIPDTGGDEDRVVRGPLFSVIVPTFNSKDTLERCLMSVLRQGLPCADLEIIVVDDCSTDPTPDIAKSLCERHANLRVARTEANAGPGIARNVGLDLATGEWILFVDSDDRLQTEALSKLKSFIEASGSRPLDAVGFDWRYDGDRVAEETDVGPGMRRDHIAIGRGKDILLKEYLALHMDGSVIYTAVRRQLIERNGLRFEGGYHEDVDYIFKVYWFAHDVGYLPEVLYFKNQRAASIVNTVSSKHIEGFMRAWGEVASFCQQHAADRWDTYRPFYQIGLIGVVATRAREVFSRISNEDQAASLYETLYECWNRCRRDLEESPSEALETKYFLIARRFDELMGNHCIKPIARVRAFTQFMEEIMTKSWGCTDLYHSAFLAPDQVRTCCKRFFVEGELRGDVVLFDVAGDEDAATLNARILEEKRGLLADINCGKKTPCDGCPFLEFKEWGGLEPLDVHYLSLEYHSVCNLRCSYCCELFYGGELPRYNVAALIDELLKGNALERCSTIVWGGGEPVLHRDFESLVKKLMVHLPATRQRVLTNALVHSDAVQQLLATGNASVTTSIDAGTKETFLRVRGRPGLEPCLKNLERYAAVSASSVTIKYIFTEGNCTVDEVRAFALRVREHHLVDCNFQISMDFKEEDVSLDDLIPMVVLHELLVEMGGRIVFLDDLLCQRLHELDQDSLHEIVGKLGSIGVKGGLALPSDYTSVAIWGGGWQAKYLLEKTAFFRSVSVEFFVDSRDSMIGGHYMGHEVKGPDALVGTDTPILIAAVQSAPLIYSELQRLGIEESRVIRQLVL